MPQLCAAVDRRIPESMAALRLPWLETLTLHCWEHRRRNAGRIDQLRPLAVAVV